MTSRCQGLFPPHPFFKGKALATRLARSLTLDKLREVTFRNKVIVELHGVVFSLSVRSARKLRMHDVEYGRRQSGREFRALDL